MTKKTRSEKKKAAKMASRSSKPKPTKNKVKVFRRNRNSAVAQYAQLIKNPCSGPLVRSAGLSIGSDFVQRVRASFSPTNATTTCGYVAWFPSYHGAGPSGSPSTGCLFQYGAVSPATNPTSTFALPMGTNTVDELTQGRFMTDPNWANLGSSTPFIRSKTSAACLQMDWLGQLASTQGQMCSIANLSLAEFNRLAGTAALFSPPSVDTIFAYAAQRERLRMEGHEVIWSPSDTDCKMRSSGAETSQVLVYPGTDDDILFQVGVPGTSNTWVATTEASAARGILLAYRGFAVGSAVNLTFNAVKIVEHELAPRNGAIEAPPARPVTTTSISINSVVDRIRSMDPEWQRTLVSVGSNFAARAVRHVAEVYAPPVRRNIRGSYLELLDGEL